MKLRFTSEAVSSRLSLLILAAMLTLFGQYVRAATYYVATTGNDSNPGTEGAPFLTLIEGAAVAHAGDTVIVMNGTYGNYGVVEPNFVVTLQNSGTPGNPITFMAQNRGQVILDSGNTSTTTTCNGAAAYFNLYNASFIVIQGFVIQHGCDSGIQSNNAAHDITLRWNTIQYIANRTVTDQIGRDGIYLNSSEYNFTFDGNTFHDIGRTGGITPRHFDHGIYAAASNLTIINNVFYNMTSGWSIQIDGGSNWLIANNTFAFADTSDGEPGQIMLWNPVSGITIENNIFYEPNSSALTEYAATISGSTFNNNLIYGVSSVGVTIGLTVGSNMIGSDPLFVNATTAPYNFALQSGSPAIAAGVILSNVIDDITGALRVSRPAIGAYDTTDPSAVNLTAASSTVTVQQGNAVTDVIAAALASGSAVSVAYSASSLPAGVTAGFSAASCMATCTTTLTLSAASTAAAGTYNVVVTGASSAPSVSTTIAITIVASPGSGPPNITAGLAAEWKFSEGSGNYAYDSSGNVNTATLTNATWWRSTYGETASFNGTSSYGSVAESASLEMTNQLTVAFWVYTNSNSNTDPRIISKLYDWNVKLNGASHYPQFSVGSQYAELNYSLPLNSWRHVAFTFSNGVVTGYVDGVQVPLLANTFTGTATLPQYEYGLYLANDAGSGGFYAGSLEDVRVYNVALTGADVAALYSALQPALRKQ